MDVVGRAVERIDDPRWRGIRAGSCLQAGPLFFAEEIVIGETLLQVTADGALRAEVGVGDEIEASLLAALEFRSPLFEDRRPASGRLAGRVEIVRQFLFRHR